jgi:putative aldouronate transport system substrate-binding protein
MKMVKRRVASLMVLASVLMSLGFAGCTKTKTETPTGSEPKGDPVKLNMYFIGGGQAKDADKVNEAISDYTKTKINATINITQFDWGSYDSKINAMVASNEQADVVFTCGWAFNFLSNAKNGALIELDNLISKYGKEVISAVGQDNLNALKIDGKLYTIPINKDKAHNYALMFNKALVDKYNLDIKSVKKLEDIEPMLKVIKDKEPGIHAYSNGAGMGNSAAMLADYDGLAGNGDLGVPGAIYSNGDKEQKVFNQFATPEFKSYSQLMAKWTKLGYMRSDLATLKNNNDASEGKVFCMPQQSKPGKGAELSNTKVTWEQVELTPAVISTSDLNNSMYGITRGSKNPEKAMEFLNLLYSDEKLANMVVYGLEGTHYTMENGQVKQIGNSGYSYSDMAWTLGNQFLIKTKVGENPDKMKLMKQFNDSSKKSPAAGFIFNSDPVKTELSNINTVTNQYVPLLVTGEVDIDKTLPEFLDKLKGAGTDKVIAEVQKQYDAFKSKK